MNEYDPYPLAARAGLIDEWKRNGIDMGAEYLFVVTDQFDWHDYPVYVMPGDDADVIRLEYTREMVEISKEYKL